MRFLLTCLSILTLIAGTTFFVTLNYFPPYLNNPANLIVINLFYFFVSLWVFIACGLTILLYSYRNLTLKKRRKEQIESLHLPKLVLVQSLRQGIIFATAIAGIGLLHVFKLSNPLNIVLLISILILIEIYFFGH
jgi:hypothetical protein